MSECHDLVHSVEDDRVLQHPIIVELAQIFNFCDASLVELEIILFQTKVDRLNNIVDDRHGKIWVVAIYGTQEDGEDVDAAVLNFAGLRKHLGENRHNLRYSFSTSMTPNRTRNHSYLLLFPMEPTNLLKNLCVIPLS